MFEAFSKLPRWVFGVLTVAVVLGAGYVYRDHVYESGRTQGVADQKEVVTEAIAKARADDAATTADVVAGLQQQLKEANDAHTQREAALRKALDAAGAHSVRISAELARLHDAAAAGSPGLPDPAAIPGDPARAAEADASLADLMETVDDNYSICLRNSARLAALQDWYLRISSGQNPSPGQD